MRARPFLLALAFCSFAACPGELQNPERFLTGSDGGGPGCDVETEIFAARCALSGCHDSTVNAAQGLDLASPGVANRLRTGLATCASVAGQPLAQFLVSKVKPLPGCGGQMPPGLPLDAGEIRCIEQYIAALDGGMP